jgi:hypothetical protein
MWWWVVDDGGWEPEVEVGGFGVRTESASGWGDVKLQGRLEENTEYGFSNRPRRQNYSDLINKKVESSAVDGIQGVL